VDVTAAARVRSGAVDLHCVVWNGGADRTAVLVHGNGAHAHWWDALVPALVPGWRLVVPDLRGHGESAWAEPPAYRIQDFGADLTAVLDALAPAPVALVGHSMGGRIALWYATRHPERVRALAMLDTRLEPVRPELAAKYRAGLDGRREGRSYPTREAALAAFRFVPDEAGVPAAVVAELAAHAVGERGPGDWRFRFDRAVLALDGDGADDLLERAREVRCPVWIAAGEASWVCDPPERAAIAVALPGAAWRIFPGGHHFLLAHADAVGRALRAFLDEAVDTEGR
jgi:pimeloyl-ACP methyl ester carboxylesterase